MRFEEQFPYYEFNIAPCRFGGSAYNFNVQNGINEWLEMRKKIKPRNNRSRVY